MQFIVSHFACMRMSKKASLPLIYHTQKKSSLIACFQVLPSSVGRRLAAASSIRGTEKKCITHGTCIKSSWRDQQQQRAEQLCRLTKIWGRTWFGELVSLLHDVCMAHPSWMNWKRECFCFARALHIFTEFSSPSRFRRSFSAQYFIGFGGERREFTGPSQRGFLLDISHSLKCGPQQRSGGVTTTTTECVTKKHIKFLITKFWLQSFSPSSSSSFLKL